MSRADSGNVRRAKATPNVYTALAIIAFVVLAAGVGWVWKSNLDLLNEAEYGDEAGSNGFYMIPADQ